MNVNMSVFGGDLLTPTTEVNFSAQCLYGDTGCAELMASSSSMLASAASISLTALSSLLVAPWVLAISIGVLCWCTQTIPFILCDRRRVAPQKLPTSIWTIHGKHYDLSSWAKEHPGGKWAIDLGRNRDCTGLFESYHVFVDEAKLDKILARFEIPSRKSVKGEPNGVELDNNQTGLVFRDEFHRDVKKLLRSHFKGKSHKMKPWVACLLAFLTCCEVYVTYLFLHGSAIAVVLLPFIGWLLCANVAHDGSHFAASRRPCLNTLASYMGMPLCFPSTGWHLQHVIQHHVYTNDEDDVDLYHFLPICRTSQITQWTTRFSFQWLTIFALLPTTVGHLMFTVPVDLLSGQVDLVTGTKRYSQCQNLGDFVARFRSHIVLEWVACVAFFGLSVYMQGFWGMRRLFMVYSISSYLFIINTQGAHLQGACMVGKEGQYKSWAKRQTATSVNFHPDSYLWLLFTGGLNLQSLHHVAPCVGSSHFIDLYPEYKKLCQKHGVHVKEVKNIFEFFQGFLMWIRELAREPDNQ
mmetsp:Transcript_90924/g.211564  ORF Transcript_90924/g.211564 Transcript_90924/m.211564 type:complete len:523 (+) Transcript_90924:140-1708(+)